MRTRVGHADAGAVAGALRPVGVLVDEEPLAGFGVSPTAFGWVAHPHTIILSASARSRCFLMLMTANATSAAAAIDIHMRDLICMPPWTGWAEGVNALLPFLDGIMRLPLRSPSPFLLASEWVSSPPIEWSRHNLWMTQLSSS